MLNQVSGRYGERLRLRSGAADEGGRAGPETPEHDGDGEPRFPSWLTSSIAVVSGGRLQARKTNLCGPGSGVLAGGANGRRPQAQAASQGRAAPQAPP